VGANLGGSLLSDADLSGANLTDADLRGAIIVHANLHDALPRWKARSLRMRCCPKAGRGNNVHDVMNSNNLGRLARPVVIIPLIVDPTATTASGWRAAARDSTP